MISEEQLNEAGIDIIEILGIIIGGISLFTGCGCCAALKLGKLRCQCCGHAVEDTCGISCDETGDGSKYLAMTCCGCCGKQAKLMESNQANSLQLTVNEEGNKQIKGNTY